ncbi:hypothetical protein P152DRAFT_458398 [Eremomyces bilateralis CBS 781.70]|uniref:Uncharacterized protein n=1 Tax=Eremomyces bilateralis CBS 781.70 TaxID=1392243 RepID=A0A6G1G3S8_9PEZI|nr:uncharacterized protein P152DRAFT_458398 [Eremomyces bilateralis CBS 781.70]KAF1812570.1 hypothetical protein P152DRAFT_458398 [Eremomyces bilateralis CBS 781.70]
MPDWKVTFGGLLFVPVIIFTVLFIPRPRLGQGVGEVAVFSAVAPFVSSFLSGRSATKSYVT